MQWRDPEDVKFTTCEQLSREGCAISPLCRYSASRKQCRDVKFGYGDDEEVPFPRMQSSNQVVVSFVPSAYLVATEVKKVTFVDKANGVSKVHEIADGNKNDLLNTKVTSIVKIGENASSNLDVGTVKFDALENGGSYLVEYPAPTTPGGVSFGGSRRQKLRMSDLPYISAGGFDHSYKLSTDKHFY